MKKIIAIALVLIMSLSIMTMAVSATPEGLNSLAIVGSGIPGAAADWTPSDPAGDMTEVGTSSVYEKTVTLAAGATMIFKVAGNDAWDDNWNFGFAVKEELVVLGQKTDLVRGNASQDMKLAVDKAGDYKITVDLSPLANGGAATILVADATSGGSNNGGSTTQPTTTQPTTTQPTTTQNTTTGNRNLTIEAPASWTKVYVYTWEPEEFNTYPGAVVQKSGNVYKASIKNSMVNLVVTGEKADSTQQKTDDLVLETNGKDVTIKIADDGKATITYAGGSSSSSTSNRKPAAADPQGNLSIYRVVGNAAWMGSWDAASDLGRMIDMGNGVYRKNFDNVEPGSYQLKITKDGKWDNAYGVNGQNFTFTVDQKCKITVDFKLNGDTGVIEVYGTGVPALGDLSMLSVVVLMALASVTAIVLVVNKKKFI